MYRMSLGLSCITLSLINCSTYQTICLPVALGHCLPWAGPAPLPACTICNCGVLWTAGIQACLSCIYKVMGFWPGDCLGILSSNLLEVFWPIFCFFCFFSVSPSGKSGFWDHILLPDQCLQTYEMNYALSQRRTNLQGIAFFPCLIFFLSEK